MSIRKISTLLSLFVAIGTAHAAKVEVDGDLTLKTEVQNSAIAAVAVGAGSKAHADVGTVKGNVRIKGNLKLDTTVKNSAVAAVAVGALSTATAQVGSVVGE